MSEEAIAAKVDFPSIPKLIFGPLHRSPHFGPTQIIWTSLPSIRTALSAPFGGTAMSRAVIVLKGWIALHAETRSAPGGYIAAAWATPDHLDLFTVTADHAVSSIWWDRNSGYRTEGWFGYWRRKRLCARCAYFGYLGAQIRRYPFGPVHK